MRRSAVEGEKRFKPIWNKFWYFQLVLTFTLDEKFTAHTLKKGKEKRDEGKILKRHRAKLKKKKTFNAEMFWEGIRFL